MVLRRWVQIGVAGTILGAALAVAVFLTLPRSGGAVVCSDSWIAASGDWGVPGNWSKNAVPGSGDDACIIAGGTYTVTMSSSSTVAISSLTLGAPSGAQTLVIGSGMTFAGAILINPTGVLTLGDAGNADTRLTCGGTCTSSLSNAGLLKTVQGGGGARYIEDDITNGAGATIDYAAGQSYESGGFCGNTSRGITNQGTVKVEGGAQFTVICGSFFNQSGSVNNVGGFGVGGGGGSTFVQRGGTVSGQAVLLSNGSVLDDDTTAAAGIFGFLGGSNPSTGNPNRLTGHGASPGVAPGQTVTISSGASIQVDGVSNAGTILVGDSGIGDSTLYCYGGCLSTLTNTTGTLKTVVGGGGTRVFDGVNINNQAGGTLDYAAYTLQGGGLCGNTGRGITNSGTVVVEPPGQIVVTCGGFMNMGGALINNGAVSINATRFVQRGGSESGNAVVLSNGGVLDDDTMGNAGFFTITGPPNPSTGNPNRLTGSGGSPGVAPGQTVTISSGASIQIDNVSNAGTILVGDSGTGDSTLYCYGGCLSTLTNTTGTLRTVAGGGGTRVFDGVNINNQAGGTLDYAAYTVQGGGLCGNPGRGITNNGLAVFEATGHVVVSCGGYVQGSGGTFKTTINGTTNAFGQLSNGSVTLDGKLQVTTIGSPAKDSTWPIISNATRSGTFASWDLRSTNYWQHYLANGLTLVAEGTCNTWIGGVDSLFHSANNWSFGVSPASTDDACITATTATIPPAPADTYTVRADNNPTVHSLTVGGTSGTQSLTIPSSFTLNINADSAISPHGVLVLGDAGTGGSALGCQGASCTANGPTLTNAGALNTVQGTGDVRHIQMVLVTNMAGGSMDIAGNTSLTGGCQPGGGIANTRGLYNNGTVTVEAGGVLQALCGLTNTGTVANHGAVQMGGDEFVQRGTETGNPVIFAGGSGLDPDTASGPGSFLFMESGGIRPSGSHPGIAAGDTVTIASTNTTVGVAPPITNAGTIVLGDGSGSGDSSICCEYFTAPATITNTGTIRTVQGGSGIRHIGVNVANALGGTVDIATDTRQESSQNPSCGLNGNNATWMTNNGTFTIEVGRHYTLANCGVGSLHQETFNQGSSGTLQTTLDVSAPPAAVMTGGAVNLDGALKVTTVGSPALGSQWPIISGAIAAGGFLTFDFGGIHYAWHYPGDGITLMLMGLNPCAQLGNGWGCIIPLSPPPSSPPGTWLNRP